ncbi:MAG TPA: hypothetical protein VFF76_00330 [Holophagaceae bacterium]|nr:hypothetical protein [Holophagaceae bacterium]
MQEVITAEAKALATTAHSTLELVANLVITTDDQYESAASLLKEVKSQANKLEETRKGITRPMDEAKQKVMDFFRAPLDKLTKAESGIKSAILVYQRKKEEEQRKIEAERRRQQEEADRKRREEEAAALRAREEAEQKQREAEAAARKAEALKTAGNTGAAAAAEAAAKAKAMIAEESSVKADAAVDAATTLAPLDLMETPMPQRALPKVSGLSSRKVWKARVINANLVPRDFLMVDEKKLADFAKAMGETAKVDGVEFYSEEILSSRS